jgi:hypothetical protein
MADYMGNHASPRQGALGEALRARMAVAGLTINDLAAMPPCAKAGVSTHRITYLRHSDAKSLLDLRSREGLSAIAESLNCDIADLFKPPIAGDEYTQPEATRPDDAPNSSPPMLNHQAIP